MKRVSLFVISICAITLFSALTVSAAGDPGMTKNPAFINGKINERPNGDIEVTNASGKMLIKKETHTAGHCYRFGELFEQQGDARMAKKYYKLCLKKDPEHHMAKVKLGMEKMTPEEEEAERKKEEERRRLNTPPPGTVGAGGKSASLGNSSELDLSQYKEEAVQHYRIAGSTYRRAGKILKGGGTAQDAMELLDKAISEYQAALKIEPKFHEARHDLCVICKVRGAYSKGREKTYKLGLKEAEKYLKSNKKDVEIMHLAAFFAARLGKVPKAESLLKKGLKVKPHDPELVLALSACYLAQRLSGGKLGVDKARAKKAVKLLEDALAKHPEHVVMRKTLARALISAEDPEQARRVYRGILDISKGDPDAYCGLGRLSYMDGKFDEAVQYLEKALATDPEHHDALSELVLVYRSKKDMEKEAHYLEEYIKRHPKGQNVKLFKKRLDELKKKLEKKNK